MIYTTLEKIADISRANNDYLYPAYTNYIELSATKGLVGMIKKDGNISNRNAIIKPKIKINPIYFNIALQNALPKFINKYLTTINLQLDVVGKMEIAYDPNMEAQENAVKTIIQIDNMIEATKKTIHDTQNFKKILLDKMLVTGE